MPVFLNPKFPGPQQWPSLDWPRARPGELDDSHRPELHIGLVNNMNDAAMCTTEFQFLRLLDAASGDILVYLTLYALPEVERTVLGQSRVDSFYLDIEQLREQPPEQCPDGLIITGREPRTPDLRDEAYWPSLKRILVWSQEHARSTVWSCLAAHAAVLALDGIQRVRSQYKHFGIYTCEQATPHALLAGAPASLRVPHSRWNGVSSEQLVARGYQVLTRTSDGGVDAFVKQDSGLFVFFQGHPEYEPETLMGEYRRDVGRYLRGEMETYPLLPLDYFDEKTERSLREFEANVRTSPRDKPSCELSTVLSDVRIHSTWRSTAILVYRNWLDHLCTQRRHSGRLMVGVGA